MASSYTNNNGLEKPATGEQNGTWGTTCNTDFDLLDTALDGWVSITLSAATATVAITDGATSDGRNRVLMFTGTPGANCTVTVTPNDAEKVYFVYNGTTGGFNVIMAQGGGSGTTVTVANGYWSLVRLDGTGTNANVTRLLDSLEVITAIKAATHTAAAALTIKPGEDSTTAIKLQNAAGTQVFGLDTTNSRVIIGTTVPGSKFEINNNTVAVAPITVADIHVIGADGGGVPAFVGTGFGNAGGFFGRVASGTAAAPSAAGNGNYLCQLQGRGYLASAWSGRLGAVSIQAEETFTGSTAKTGILFETTAAGAVAASEKMRLTGAGQLAIGNSAPGVSVGLELNSTTLAVLLPRMTTAQRDALTAVAGMVIYNTTTGKMNIRGASAWEAVTSV